MTTPFHSKYWANELTLLAATGSIESLSRSIAVARVDLNPHQVDAALFALRSPLTRGVMPADEGMEFLKRMMPLGARFPAGEIFREDRFPVPLDALREILLNAVMHRDYSHYSGHVAVVVFDDRIEIRSYGRLPNGVTVKQLSGKHISKPTNPLIAGAFHRTGAVEVWGRGTNRVIAMCKKHGAAPPTFEEMQGFLIVTFKAQIGRWWYDEGGVEGGVAARVVGPPRFPRILDRKKYRGNSTR